MKNKLKFYRFEECWLCSGTGVVETKIDVNELFSLVEQCPCCNGNCNLQIEMDLNDK